MLWAATAPEKPNRIFQLCPWEARHQLSFEDFWPFSGKLFADNRWIQLAALIPWDDLEDDEHIAGLQGLGCRPAAADGSWEGLEAMAELALKHRRVQGTYS